LSSPGQDERRAEGAGFDDRHLKTQAGPQSSAETFREIAQDGGRNSTRMGRIRWTDVEIDWIINQEEMLPPQEDDQMDED
jgi:hypothetical protein